MELGRGIAVASRGRHLDQQCVAVGEQRAELPRALLHPRALAAAVRGVAHDLGPALRGRQPWPSLRPAGGRLGLPADFLIGPDGTVLASKHGRHADDHWSVDEVLTLAAGAVSLLSGPRPRNAATTAATPATAARNTAVPT